MKSLFKIYINQLNSSLQNLSGIQNYECTFDYEHRGKSYFFELTNNSPSPLPTLSSKKKKERNMLPVMACDGNEVSCLLSL